MKSAIDFPSRAEQFSIQPAAHLVVKAAFLANVDTVLAASAEPARNDPASGLRPRGRWHEGGGFRGARARIDKLGDGTIKRLGFVPWSGWQEPAPLREFNDIALGHLFGSHLAILMDVT
ncbi:hypothetical protein [Actinopolymorpha alba]|uniref:hypothetical protein n=1 Tax=Actinopolymorpha alba TaxID=533267 RepID=UPI0004771D0E|nr:hypothetical protein [Actinopolymorpha alba]